VLKEQAFRKEPELSQYVFDRFLTWLDDGTDSHGETYLEIRRRLVTYFDRRNRPAAEELADETLNRVARTLEESGSIHTRPPARYCYVIAKFVLLEDLRRERRHVGLDETRVRVDARILSESTEELARHEERLACLDQCLTQLEPEQRALIVDYYRDTRRQKIERRRELANRLGISMNALAIRASRIRNALSTCLEGCRKRPKDLGRRPPIQMRPR
jgi:DNA-directed RNA polymerase specialized sigma24 family protein